MCFLPWVYRQIPYQETIPYPRQDHTMACIIPNFSVPQSFSENLLVGAPGVPEAIDPSFCKPQFSEKAPLLRTWHIRLSCRRKRKGLASFRAFQSLMFMWLLPLKCTNAVREVQSLAHSSLMRAMHGNIDMQPFHKSSCDHSIALRYMQRSSSPMCLSPFWNHSSRAGRSILV